MLLELKQCPKCKQWKPVSEFNKSRNRKDGLRCYCKKCQVIYRKEYYQKNKERALTKIREYARIHERKINEYRQQ